MPTYEYKCKSCGYVFEKFQPISGRPVRTCPECGGQVERVIHGGSGFIFKGSGFYATDYRSDEYKKREKEEKGEKPASSKAKGKTAESSAGSDSKSGNDAGGASKTKGKKQG